MCVSKIKGNQKIETSFWEGIKKIPDLVGQFNEESLTFFYKIWLRKITHARIQEFISIESGSIHKGGHNLRDNLYAHLKKLSSKRKNEKTDMNETKGADQAVRGKRKSAVKDRKKKPKLKSAKKNDTKRTVKNTSKKATKNPSVQTSPLQENCDTARPSPKKSVKTLRKKRLF